MRVIFNSSPSHPTLLSLFLARLGEFPLQEKFKREHVGLLSVCFENHTQIQYKIFMNG